MSFLKPCLTVFQNGYAQLYSCPQRVSVYEGGACVSLKSCREFFFLEIMCLSLSIYCLSPLIFFSYWNVCLFVLIYKIPLCRN